MPAPEPHPRSYAALHTQCQQIMSSNIDRFNPSNIPTMEAYVEAQAKETRYDLEGNLLLLKLYQLNPGASYSAGRAPFVAKILLMALMQLPRNDFQICKALIEPELTKVLRIRDVLDLEVSLEKCEFEGFWVRFVKNVNLFTASGRGPSPSGVFRFPSLEAVQSRLTQSRDAVIGVEGFDAAVREYILSVIEMTNQSIKERQLQLYLGGLPYPEFKQIIEKKGWTFQRDTGHVYIKDQVISVKPRKINEAIDFADVATLLAAAGRH